MKTYARMKGSIVTNIEVATEAWVAAQPNPAIFIEFTEANPACQGGDHVNGYFYVPQPFPSWSRDGQGNWQAPVAYPADGGRYQWDEITSAWIAMPSGE